MARSTRHTARKPTEPTDIRYEQPEAPSPDGGAKPHAEINRAAEVARYIAQLTTEMQHLAAEARLETLSYFLSLARVEAEMMARHDLAASLRDDNAD